MSERIHRVNKYVIVLKLLGAIHLLHYQKLKGIIVSISLLSKDAPLGPR